MEFANNLVSTASLPEQMFLQKSSPACQCLSPTTQPYSKFFTNRIEYKCLRGGTTAWISLYCNWKCVSIEGRIGDTEFDNAFVLPTETLKTLKKKYLSQKIDVLIVTLIFKLLDFTISWPNLLTFQDIY